MMPVRRSVLAVLVAVALTVACGKGSGTTTTTPSAVTPSFFASGVVAFVSGVRTIDGTGVQAVHLYGRPAASTGSVAPSLTGDPNVVSSGAGVVRLVTSSPFQKILISVANSGTQVDGFWQVDLAAPTTDTSVLVSFVPSLPGQGFDLRFQVVSPAGIVGPPAVISTAVATSVATLRPSVVATYSPSPAPFLNGVACVLSSAQGCLWEFKVLLQEFNGVAVATVTLNETYTFGSTVTTGALPISIPGNGLATVVRTVACGAPTISCVPVSQLSGGTYSYTLSGTDANGAGFNFTGPVLTLRGR
jgi:hypothetical protein